MSNFLKMDIFFVVATLAIVVLGVMLGIVLVRALRILKNVEHISENISEESDTIRKDFERLRTKAWEESLRLRAVGKFFKDMIGRFVPKKRRK